MTAQPQPPVWIPDHLHHGSSYVYRHYKCRCGLCQNWRRGYDRDRDQASRRPEGPGNRDRYPATAPWYVCAQAGHRYRRHEYLAGQCLRCDAVQETEELWELRWRQTK